MKVLLETCVWGGARDEISAAGHDVVWTGDWKQDPGDKQILRDPLIFDMHITCGFYCHYSQPIALGRDIEYMPRTRHFSPCTISWHTASSMGMLRTEFGATLTRKAR